MFGLLIYSFTHSFKPIPTVHLHFFILWRVLELLPVGFMMTAGEAAEFTHWKSSWIRAHTHTNTAHSTQILTYIIHTCMHACIHPSIHTYIHPYIQCSAVQYSTIESNTIQIPNQYNTNTKPIQIPIPLPYSTIQHNTIQYIHTYAHTHTLQKQYA